MADGIFLRFPDLADFRLNLARGLITAYRYLSTSPGFFRHLIIDQVVPRTLGQLGQTVIHGSAVRVPGGCVAFVGATGRGKSTLAASFVSAGYQPLGDDALKLMTDVDGTDLDGVMAVSSYPGLRLGPAAGRLLSDDCRRAPVARGLSGKARYDVGRETHPAEPLRLLAVFSLEADHQGGPPKLHECSGAESVAELIRVAFSLNPRNPGHQVALFHALSTMLEKGLKVFRLGYVREFEVLPQVRSAVLEAIAGLGAETPGSGAASRP